MAFVRVGNVAVKKGLFGIISTSPSFVSFINNALPCCYYATFVAKAASSMMSRDRASNPRERNRQGHSGSGRKAAIQPVRYVLGKHRTMAKQNNKKRIVEVDDVFYYIPILSTIGVQLMRPEILAMVMCHNPNNTNTNILQNLCDGSFFKAHELFSNDERALQILVYYDDVNFVNPMTNKPHKISMFYYQLGNLRPEVRSRLKCIHLWAVSKTAHLSNPAYGFDKIVEPLVKDLKLLGADRGFKFVLGPSDNVINLRGAIFAFIADTPASQKAGGRMATFNTMQIGFTEEEFNLRVIDEHKKYLSKIENTGSRFLKTFYSKFYGINRETKLMDAPYFDPCEQLPQDVMHVFLEGVVAYELRIFLQYYILEMKAFELNELNTKLQNFPYGYSHRKNKPSIILERDLNQQSHTNLGQNASQMWLLSCVLPLILAQFVDTKSERWKCLLSLLEIMSICLSHKISVPAVSYMKRAIKEHLSLFKKIYPQANIIPKQHYLVHLPSQILKFGPLIRLWCMRFEAKHSYFKEEARHVKNFKNLPFSFAKRYVNSLEADSISFHERETSTLLNNDITFGATRELNGTEKDRAKSYINRFYDHAVSTLHEVDTVHIRGIYYKSQEKSSYLHIGVLDELPKFASIQKLWFEPSQGIYFGLHVMRTLKYDDIFNTFQIQEPELPEGLEITHYDDLDDPFIFHSYRYGNIMHVIVKENPFSYT